MLCTLVLLLFVVLNVLQCEGNNQTYLDRPKRRLREDVIKAAILQNEMEKRKGNSKFQSGDCTKSNLYESILKDFDDIAFSKKAEIEDNEDAAHSDSECRECFDKGIESDPLMTKFYTFSKMTADEHKPISWIDLLTSPIVQSLVKPKDADVSLRNKVSSSVDKFQSGDIGITKDQVNTKKDMDDASFNNILQIFASLGNRNNEGKKNNDRETEVGYSNQASSNNDVTENKFSSSCLVENKSNYFKTDQGPYNRVIAGVGALDILGRVNAALGNLSNSGRFEKTNHPVNNMPYLIKENINEPDSSPTLPNDQYPNMIGQNKALRYPELRNHHFNIYNFSRTSPAMDRANMPPRIELNSSNKNNNFFDVLGDITIDDPRRNSSQSFSYTQDIKQNLNETYLKSSPSSYNTDLQQSFQPSILNNALSINSSASNSNLNHVNFQNLIQSPDTLEKICLLDKIINSNKFSEPNKFNNNYLNSSSIAHSALANPTLETKFDNKNDIRALSDYIISHKMLNTQKIKPENKTMIQLTDTDRKWNVSSPDINTKIHSESIINRTAPTAMTIGEQQQLPMPIEFKPGSQRITLPEYEKMDTVQDSTKYPDLPNSSSDVNYESILTTAVVHVESTSELPQTPHTDPLNTLHRNMIPVIDFLGQMWNNTSRKSQSGNWKSLAADCGGYVIVPLPENSMFQGWKRLEKTSALGKDAEFRDSGAGSGFSNVSVSQLITPSNRDLLEKFILKKLFDSFRGSFIPKRRTRRSKSAFEDVEDSHSQDYSSTPSNPINSTQLPPTDKWTMNSSARPAYSNTSSACH